MKLWHNAAIVIATAIFFTGNGVRANERPVRQLIFSSVADTYIRTDLDVRRNDNYGCEQFVAVGTDRGGGGIPFGGADAMRSLLQFDLSAVPPGSVKSATLEMTLFNPPYDNGTPTSVYTINVHRILNSWIEGNGAEGLSSSSPPLCTGTDPAFGVAWAGRNDNSDSNAVNNQTQPPFSSRVVATASVNQGVNRAGDVIKFDITALAKAWVNREVPNYGILLRDITSDGSFRGVRFGAREGPVAAPRLILTVVLTTKEQCSNGGWLNFGFNNRGECIDFANAN